MFKNFKLITIFLLFLSIGFFIPHIPVLSSVEETHNIENNSTRMNDEDVNEEEDSLDLLIMFNQEIPNLEPFNLYIVKKFKHFPVIRVVFDSLTTKYHFFKKYQGNIHRIEPNKVLISSFNVFPEESTKPSITKVTIQDATCASFLHQMKINGSRTRIGIIDTGVSDHTEFGTRIKDRDVFVTKDNDYSADITDYTDIMGHGTHVAGIAAGENTGIAPEAAIYSAKVIHSNSVQGAGGGGGEETTAGLLEAIEYLVNNSVDVINISLGQYHNLPNGLRDEVINYVSINNKTVFSVSAGNSGTNSGDRGTLNNPTTSLQCISVTASDIAGSTIASFASKGPKVDYSLKPDITAPGVSIYGPIPSGYITKSGTSMAAPIVTGAAALLIDFLKSKNLKYSAATIKAALLAGARTLGRPIWEEGAGFINITRSWEILNSTAIINDTPDLLYLHPQKLPFDPYKVLFNGSSVLFNLTLVNSRYDSTNIEISNSISNFVSTSNPSYIDNCTSLLSINFTIPTSTNPKFVSGNIKVNNQILSIDFEIRRTLVNVLFDESLNQIVRHGRDTDITKPNSLGDSSSTIGMYSEFTKFLAYENNISVTPNIKREFTFEKLSKYEVFVLANPLSNFSDIYMDWTDINDPDYYSFSKESKEAIYKYIDSGGGLLIINTNNDDDYNITGLNEFLQGFDFQIQAVSSGTIRTSTIVNPQDFTTKITSFPFYGNFINVSGSYTQVIAEFSGFPTLASYENPNTGGRVLFYGSDLIFDNFGISSNEYPGNPTENRILAFNSVIWLAEAEYMLIESTPTTDIPELPYPLIFLVLLLSLGIVSILYFNNSKK